MRLSPLVAIVLTLLVTSQAGAAGTYAGWIPVPGGGAANDDPIVVTTDAAGMRVRSVVMAFRPTCTDGRQFAFHRTLPVRMTDGPGGELVPVRNSGGQFEARLQAESVSDAFEFVESGTVKGTFRRGSGQGTISVSVAVFDQATGATVMTCQTDTMSFKLDRGRGRVYGGSTDQGEPVAMFLSVDRRTVREFGVDLNAACSPAGFVDMADWITSFRIRGGAFGANFSYRDSEGDRYAYRFHGQLTRTRASGTLRMTLTTQNGDVCRTGTMKWTARSG